MEVQMTEYHYIREGQPGSELFTFVVGAEDLLQFAKVERFNEAAEGVERRLNYHHVRELVEFMRQPGANLSEPILGDLRGNWGFNPSRHVVSRNDDAVLMVDEGQHRLGALHLLSSEERSRWEFMQLIFSWQRRLSRALRLQFQIILPLPIFLDCKEIEPDGLR